MSHTSGPWISDLADETVKDAMGNTVAETHMTLVSIIPREQADANNRLIAAAPEMIAALRECAAAFSKFDPDPDSRYGMAWARVKAAIAKATRS